MIIFGWALLVIAFVAVVCLVYQLSYAEGTDQSVAIVSMFVFVACGSVGMVVLTGDDTERCNELKDQHKDVLLVSRSCWVGVGNGMYVEDGAKRPRIQTREELLREQQ